MIYKANSLKAIDEMCILFHFAEASEGSKDEEALKDIGSVEENKEADVAAASGDDKECKTEEPVETESKEQPREGWFYVKCW